MGELRHWKPRPRNLTVQEAEKATRRLDALAAELPTLADSIEYVRRDVAGHTERSAQWSFVMIGPKEQQIVLDLIAEEATRPIVSMRLWGAMLCRIGADTGLVMMTRAEMMEAARTKHSSHISRALKELAGWGALIRDVDGRDVRWFFNPRIATHLAAHARPWAQQQAPEVGKVVHLADQRTRQKNGRRTAEPTPADPSAGIINDRRQRPLID